MKQLLLSFSLLLVNYFAFTQSQITTTGNNTIDPSNPCQADIVIGSACSNGARHDGSIMWWSNSSASRISNTSDVFYLSVWNTTNPNIALAATVGQPSYFQGNVGIGTTSPDQKLTVRGTIHAQAVKVDLNGPLADFVFDRNYRLPTLTEVSAFIAKNHHLSEIPTAAEAATKGLDLGLLNQKLLQKVEELTLYLIQKDKADKLQAVKYNQLEKRLKLAEAKLIAKKAVN